MCGKSEENLSTLVIGQGQGQARVNNGGVYSGKLQGQVSRLLEKFDQHYTKPVRSRSTENLLDSFSSSREKYSGKPLLLPKPPALTASFKHSQVPAAPKAAPREVPPRLQVGLNQEDEPRWDSASPSHLRSTPLHSPNRSSFSSSPVPAVSDQGTKIGASDDSVSQDRFYTVSSYRKRFESVPTDGRQLTPKDLSHWTAGSPKSKEKFSKDWRAALSKESKPVENGHTAHSELGFIETNAVSAKESAADWKMGNRDNKWAKETGSGQVPSFLSASSLEASKGTNTWRPKKEVDLEKTSKLNPEILQLASRVSTPAKPSATPSEKSKQSHKVEGLVAKLTPNQCKAVSASTSLNDTFEILPAATPDFSSIPEDDIQAQALANLKKQSKNSFVVVPKKKSGDYLTSSDVRSYRQINDETPEKPKLDHNPFKSVEVPTSKISSGSWDRQRHKEKASVPESLLPPVESESEVRLKENLNKFSAVTTSRDDFEHPKHESTEPSLMKGTAGLLPNEVPQQVSKPPAMMMAEEGSQMEEYLPITNIDDIVDPEEKENPEVLLARAKLPTTQDKPQEPYSSNQNTCMQRKSGNTFTIVPQRKPAMSSPEHSNTKDTVQANGTDKSVEDPEPSFAKLGMLLKKRYPLAEEIQVIGGYLSLERSCLSKVGSTRKKLKISFNDSSLHTTFEYPSESSLVQEEESDESEDDEEETSSSFFIPRPNYTSSPSSSGSPLRTNPLVSALSNYTPKHAMQFNTWQEQKFEDTLSSRDDSLKDTESSQEDAMLTPADSSSHSDYSSEPALYF
uniref:Taperin n=1 Tax=Callorhinchus milii TaxID=7868 RepID=V9KFL9_CALMI